MDTLPIAELAKGSACNSTKSIRAVVTLIWPYSSSTHRAALLLAEPDFRLRNKKGQVRVQLAGASAKAVAKSKISSGDEVVLRLEGAKCVEAVAGINTPGRSVDVELEYRRRIVCTIFRGNQVLKQIDVDDQTPNDLNNSHPSPSTPNTPYYPSLSLELGRAVDLPTPASSAFHRLARVVSGELVDSPYDPFANDRGSLDHKRKKQRLSWPSESRWTVNENVPSPSKRRITDDWVQFEALQSPTTTRDRISPPPVQHHSSPTCIIVEGAVGEGRERDTQELVDLIGGDTEEEDFGLLIDAQNGAKDDEEFAAVPTAFSNPQIFAGSRFTVFRDEPSSTIPSMPDSQILSLSDIDAIATGLQTDEKAFFNLPSSDSIVEPGAIETSIQEPLSNDLEHSQEREEHARVSDGLLSSHRSLDSTLPLHISDMPPPPILPTLQTSNFTSASHGSKQPPPVSALPDSPSTPDLRPQHSSTLPLPSPFPGDELSSYIEGGHTPQQISFVSPPTVKSPVLPDWMLQIGFGFGSGELVDESGSGEEKVQTMPESEQLAERLAADKHFTVISQPAADFYSGNQRKELSIVQDSGSALDTIMDEQQSQDRVPTRRRTHRGDLPLYTESKNQAERATKQASQPLLSSRLGTPQTIELSSDEAHNAEFTNNPTYADRTGSASIGNAAFEHIDGSDLDWERNVAEIEADNNKDELLEISQSSKGVEDITEDDILEDSIWNSPRQTADLIDLGEDAAQGSSPTHSASHHLHSTFSATATSRSQEDTAKKSTLVVVDLLDESDENQSNQANEIEDEIPEQLNASQHEVSSSLNDNDLGKVPIQAQFPVVESYDGAMDFLASSSPRAVLETARKDASIANVRNATAEPTASSAAKHTQAISIPFTPEGTQQSSQDIVSPGSIMQQEVEFPPTPRLTQATTMGSVCSVAQQEARTSPDGDTNSIPVLDETPQKSTLMPFPDGASSVLSPWFGIKSRSHGREEQRQDTTLQASAIEPGTLLKGHTNFLHAVNKIETVPTVGRSQGETTPSIDKVPMSATVTNRQESALVDFSFTQSQATPDHGILTDYSYYTPLSALFSSIRIPSSSQNYNDGCVDVIAIVTKATTKPLRADKGQRDFYTTMSITDELFYPRSLRVQVFRPWRAALPKAEKGDAVLLRGFEVFSAKGNVGVGLKSVEGAAWCVWRAATAGIGGIGFTVKPWIKRATSESAVEDVTLDAAPSTSGQGKIWVDGEWREDMRGPPVELGNQERGYARKLRDWWIGEQAMSFE